MYILDQYGGTMKSELRSLVPGTCNDQLDQL